MQNYATSMERMNNMKLLTAEAILLLQNEYEAERAGLEQRLLLTHQAIRRELARIAVLHKLGQDSLGVQEKAKYLYEEVSETQKQLGQVREKLEQLNGLSPFDLEKVAALIDYPI